MFNLDIVTAWTTCKNFHPEETYLIPLLRSMLYEMYKDTMDKDQDDYAARLIQSVMDDITTHVHKLEIKLLKRIRWTLP